MLLNIDRPGRAFMKVVIAWAGHVRGVLGWMATLWRPRGYLVDQSGFPDDDAGLAGDDSPTLGRTISRADGRDVTLHWRLPSPGRWPGPMA